METQTEMKYRTNGFIYRRIPPDLGYFISVGLINYCLILNLLVNLALSQIKL
jgi:hypothetical protein